VAASPSVFVVGVCDISSLLFSSLAFLASLMHSGRANAMLRTCKCCHAPSIPNDECRDYASTAMHHPFRMNKCRKHASTTVQLPRQRVRWLFSRRTRSISSEPFQMKRAWPHTQIALSRTASVWGYCRKTPITQRLLLSSLPFSSDPARLGECINYCTAPSATGSLVILSALALDSC
jgi:hypothetical protein